MKTELSHISISNSAKLVAAFLLYARSILFQQLSITRPVFFFEKFVLALNTMRVNLMPRG